GERLVEVVVRVDEAGCDHGAVQIVARLRRVTGADSLDPAVFDPQPASSMLGAGVVHRHDPGVREDHDASSGTSSKRSTSTSPRSVSFKLGITDNPRNDSSWNGASIEQPSSRAAATI